MKKILGLDLGTSSIGWALVNEAGDANEQSSIIKLGVRVNPLTVDEKGNFTKGKSITTNADRTLKRAARRNLQRYKLRRENLIECLREHGFITDGSLLCEQGNHTTFQTYRLRSKAVTEPICLEELARVLLMINKKRGYKSSRKAKSSDEGELIDGMSVAKALYDNGWTPGQFTLSLLQQNKKHIPDFYRSDLHEELDRIWKYQQQFYPDVLNEEFKAGISGKSKKIATALFLGKYKIYTADNKGKDKRLQEYQWRVKALGNQLPIEEVAYVICELSGAINNSSGYLGAISDRSKELFFNKMTVGQYLTNQLAEDPNCSLTNQVFYRQDYLDEFEAIWEEQAKHHPQLTPALKREIRDIIIFYQRPLKSQKGLVRFCEFESRPIKVLIDGVVKIKTTGSKVCPRSSPLFQEFKVWQVLNDLSIIDKTTKASRHLNQEEKETLFQELSIKDKLTKTEVLKLLYKNYRELDLSHKAVEGNRTQAALFKTYQSIIFMSGHGEYDFAKMRYAEVYQLVKEVFGGLGYRTDMLTFDSSVTGRAFDKQPMYLLWHLLYSYENDNSTTGTESLLAKIAELCGIEEKEYATCIAHVVFDSEYASLSTKAIRKILPSLREGHSYYLACDFAGYRHSSRSLTKKELDQKVYKDYLDILPKNSLRNPVVEKILNQMINVVNEIVSTYGKPDEIRIELARELKNNAKEREEMVKAISKATIEHEKYRKILIDEFGLTRVSRNDIIRYKLYLELKDNGFHTLYSNTYIPQEKLFSKEFDVDHIIPQAKYFDDSFSNKTLETREDNIKKGSLTACDYVANEAGDSGVKVYKARLESLYKSGVLRKAKYDKLLMQEADIPAGCIDRELRDSQYIATKAREILEDLVKFVVPTTGSITSRLREDWQLVDVMKELNWDKYDTLGLTEIFDDRDGRKIRRIKNWTKRNDHRHHAMDALTVAFTKRNIIQYLNNMNARSDQSKSIYTIEQNELQRDKHGKLRFVAPMPIVLFRAEAKRHLENLLVSIKAKNKVVTRNLNRTKGKNGYNKKIQLTPRGQLHNETIYGTTQQYVTKLETVNASFDAEQIAKVASKKYRDALSIRLSAFDNNPQEAFTGKNNLEKNPVYCDKLETERVPTKVKTVKLETIYTIRKEIGPDLKIEKVIDKKIARILQNRLDKFGGDAKKAFSNLSEKPIWLNEEKRISIKRVTVTGVNHAIPLHEKKDNTGNHILDSNNQKQPVDYVNTSNNHHVAIYRDEKENLQEKTVSFYEATARALQNLPVIDKEYKHAEGWSFLFSMKTNEYFLFSDEEIGFDPAEIDLLDPENYAMISPNLFRVQKLSTKDYYFRHHLETNVDENKELKEKTWKRIKSLKNISKIVKVRINHIGEIVSVGEY